MITNTSILPLCDNHVCGYSFKPAHCSENVNIIVSALNQLGEGPSTKAITIGMYCTIRSGSDIYYDTKFLDCLNNFVEVKFDRSTSTIICMFLNRLNTAEKSCSVTYGVCQHGPTQTAMSNSTEGDTVSLVPRPIPSFSMLHAVTLKSWEWAWG